MVSLLDSKDVEVVSYRYNGWSKILETVDTSDNQVAARNPFCYRGYILAEETGCTMCPADIMIRRQVDF